MKRKIFKTLIFIGSTTIPYLSAKPILDIAIKLKNFESGVKCIAKLEQLKNNKTARIEYEQLKIQLSQTNPNNKHKYANDKTNFVKSILAKK
ncbi:hypothetical protein COJ48_14385 [Bacillus cereus]|nr:hypothetical protein COJ48_14385 [Bacillus cereus]PGP79747.1 hypothetical protein CN997_18345 [Bacillus cereus]